MVICLEYASKQNVFSPWALEQLSGRCTLPSMMGCSEPTTCSGLLAPLWREDSYTQGIRWLSPYTQEKEGDAHLVSSSLTYAESSRYLRLWWEGLCLTGHTRYTCSLTWLHFSHVFSSVWKASGTGCPTCKALPLENLAEKAAAAVLLGSQLRTYPKWSWQDFA